MTTHNSSILARAIALAASAHVNQTDKRGEPYILHTLKVMYLLKSKDEELMAIAVLHDAVEDQGVTYQQLRELGMSNRIIEGIRAMTTQLGQTPEEYMEGLYANIDAAQVKLSDLRHNSDFRRLKGTSPKDEERLIKYARMYYDLNQYLNHTAAKP